MPYCELEDVQQLIPKRKITTDTTPNVTQANAVIAQIAVEIDSVLQGRGYTVPVTTPANLVEVLKAVNSYGAGALIEQGMLPETTEPGTTSHGTWLYNIYKSWLKKLEDGLVPDTLDPVSTGTNASSYYTQLSDKTTMPDPPFSMNPATKDF